MIALKEKAQLSARTENQANVQEIEDSACKYTSVLHLEHQVGSMVYIIHSNLIIRTRITGARITMTEKDVFMLYEVVLQHSSLMVNSNNVYRTIGDAIKHLKATAIDATSHRIITTLSLNQIDLPAGGNNGR